MTRKLCDMCFGTGRHINKYTEEMVVCDYCKGSGAIDLVDSGEYVKLFKALQTIAKHKPSTTGNAIDAIADAYEEVKKMAREALK